MHRAIPAALCAALFLVPPAPAEAQAPGQIRPGATHQDWQVLCMDTGSGERCVIGQSVGDNGETVMRVAVGRLDGEVLMEISLPLGLDLRAGVQLRIGDDFQKQIPYYTCLPDGCQAVVPVDAEMLRAMRAGRNYLVAVVPLGADQYVGIEGSLMGFTAGFRAISP